MQTPIPPQEQALLEQLIDISLPEPITWWPLSLQLWAVILGVLIITTILTALLASHHKKNRYRKQALVELGNVQTENTNTFFSDINTLLKRCCFTAYPNSRAQIAQLYGYDWYTFLCNTIKPKARTKTEHYHTRFIQWQQASYDKDINIHDYQNEFIAFSQYWIRKHSTVNKALENRHKHSQEEQND